MSKLDPRPEKSSRNYTWHELNNFLQFHFSKHSSSHTFIDLRDYSMSKEEIVKELEKNGYKTSEHSEHKLRIE